DLRVANRLRLHLIELLDPVQQTPPTVPVDSGRVVEVEDGVADRAQLDSLMHGRQESAAPEPPKERLIVAVAGSLRDQNDIGGQISVFAAQAVGEPGP